MAPTIRSNETNLCGPNIPGDYGSVSIGAGSNVQDDAVLGAGDVHIGEGVTVGHGAIIKASTVGDGSMVGMKAVIEEASVEGGSMVAAGAVVSPGTVVATGQVRAGILGALNIQNQL